MKPENVGAPLRRAMTGGDAPPVVWTRQPGVVLGPLDRDARDYHWARASRAIVENADGQLLVMFPATVDGLPCAWDDGAIALQRVAILAIEYLRTIESPHVAPEVKRRIELYAALALRSLTGASEDETRYRRRLLRSSIEDTLEKSLARRSAAELLSAAPGLVDDVVDVAVWSVRFDLSQALGPCRATREESEPAIARALRAELAVRAKGRRRSPSLTRERIEALHRLARLVGCGAASDESFAVEWSRARRR